MIAIKKRHWRALLALLLGCVLAGLVVWALAFECHRGWPPGVFQLRVADARGHAVERFGWTFMLADAPDVPIGVVREEAEYPGGVVAIPGPRQRFVIEVRAECVGAVRLGPFDPKALPTRIDVVVPGGGVIKGHVTFHGQSVARARVMLLQTTFLGGGVPSGLFAGVSKLTTTTDEFGDFCIGSKGFAVQYYVRARKDGCAGGIGGPVRSGDPPLEVQLHEGGSIDGRLRLPTERELNGIEVELYRTEDSPWSPDAYGHFVARAEATGVFRFAHVDPGPWLVRLKSSEHDVVARQQVDPGLIPFVVEVVESETADLDMDLSRPLVQLEGRMTINGEPWLRTGVSLHTAGDMALRLERVKADEVGRWIVRAREPGRYRIVAEGACEHDVQPRAFVGFVDLSHESVLWEHEFESDRCTWPR